MSMEEAMDSVRSTLAYMQDVPARQVNLDIVWKKKWVFGKPCGCLAGWMGHGMRISNPLEYLFGVVRRPTLSSHHVFAFYGNSYESELFVMDEELGQLRRPSHKNAMLYRLLRLVYDKPTAQRELREYTAYGRRLHEHLPATAMPNSGLGTLYRVPVPPAQVSERFEPDPIPMLTETHP